MNFGIRTTGEPIRPTEMRPFIIPAQEHRETEYERMYREIHAENNVLREQLSQMQIDLTLAQGDNKILRDQVTALRAKKNELLTHINKMKG